MAATSIDAVRETLLRELRLLGSLRSRRELVPQGLLITGYLGLWLAALPLAVGSRVVAELPQEPVFTLSHFFILSAGVLMALGSTLLFIPAWRGRPHAQEAHRLQFLHPLGGLVECWLGLGLMGYLILVLNGNVGAPGPLMGDRTGRVAYFIFPLLFRGAGLSLAPHLSYRPARTLLDLSLLVLLLAMVCFVRYPYDLIDGDLFGPSPVVEAVVLGLIFAAATALGYWYGLRARMMDAESEATKDAVDDALDVVEEKMTDEIKDEMKDQEDVEISSSG